MFRLSIRLFGKMEIRLHGQTIESLSTAKAKELLGYLLLRRGRPVGRESVAALLWGDVPTPLSRKYLRQAVWQLQTALRCHVEPADNRLLAIDSTWIQVNPEAGIWLDVAVLERAHEASGRSAPEHFDAETLALIEEAAEIYRGDLLDGWYQDWCLQDRDRLQAMYLDLLEKLMANCEAHDRYEEGLRHGARSLCHDRARECTHQRLMRLHALAGDRAAALRQYDRCVIALDEELGAPPSEETAALYERIRRGRRQEAIAMRDRPSRAGGEPALTEVLGRLTQIESTLGDLQLQVRADIVAVEKALAPGAPDRQPAARAVSQPGSRAAAGASGA